MSLVRLVRILNFDPSKMFRISDFACLRQSGFAQAGASDLEFFGEAHAGN